jgi:hypothetical protein
MRGMNPDRHVYLVTAVVAVVTATAINVLVPRSPIQGTVVVPQTRVAAQAQPAPRPLFDAATMAPAAPQRLNALL